MNNTLLFIVLILVELLNAIESLKQDTKSASRRDVNKTESNATSKEHFFNPTAYNFCNLKCSNKPYTQIHAACECYTKRPLHKEILDNLIAFRKQIIFQLNKARRVVASGGSHLPPAADMQIMNYDLELEYFARCFGRRYQMFNLWRFRMCMRTVENVNPGVLKFEYSKVLYFDEWLKDASEKIDKNAITSFNANVLKNADASKATQLIWASNFRIGCSRILNPDATRKKFIICLMRGANNSGNIVGQPVYTIGKACESCPGSKNCPLCGSVESIPEVVANLIPWTTIVKHKNGNNDDNENKTDQRNNQTLPKSNRFYFGLLVIIILWI